MDQQEKLRALRSLLVELLVYGTLVILYALSVLAILAGPLADLYETSKPIYALVSLILIVGQGVVLEGVTSFLMDRLRLARFD